MDKRPLTLLVPTIFLLLFSLLAVPSLAAPQAQFTPYPTPTPGPDGKIIYIAQANDNAWRIAAIFGLQLNDLRTLNKWGDNPIIKEGDKIILGYAGPAEPTFTPGPSATPAPLLPSPSPMPGYGNLCVFLYNDQNGDSLHQEEEPSIPLGAISVSNRSGSVSKTAT
ncbi:MAG: LysM peptidoglycan-binding domain-containing protein, partial [Omnitrophica WOR_2 bacterium]